MLKWWSNRQGLKKPSRLLIYTKKLITSILWIYMVFVMGKVTYPVLILCLSSLAMAAWGLGCTETPFLASCQCRTHVGHQNGYESPDFDVRWVSSFFFFSLHASTWSRRVRNASNEGKRRRKSQILSLRSHFEKPTSQSSQPTLALTFVAALYPSLELDRADWRAP